MTNADLVKEIVRTYELPPKLEARVVTMSINRVNSLGLNGYDSIYRDIADLVEKCLVPYIEKMALRLVGVKGTSIYDLLVFDDATLGDTVNAQQEVPLNEAVMLLKEKLSDTNLALLLKLLGNGEHTPVVLNSSPEEILSSARQIEERLEALANAYGKNGSLYLPRIPIISIDFYPSFSIKYVHDAPRANFDEFRQARYLALQNRRRSKRVQDSQPAQTLRYFIRNGKIFRSRKKGRYNLPHDLIVSTYPIFGGNASQASRSLGIYREKVRYHWRKAGLKVKGKRYQRVPVEGILETV